MTILIQLEHFNRVPDKKEVNELIQRLFYYFSMHTCCDPSLEQLQLCFKWKNKEISLFYSGYPFFIWSTVSIFINSYNKVWTGMDFASSARAAEDRTR